MNLTEALLEREKNIGRPVRVGLVGAGQMGTGLAAQIGKIQGMELVACADIDKTRAEKALTLSGMDSIGYDSNASSSIEKGTDCHYFKTKAGYRIMYYGAKGLELLGMTMIGVGFIVKFPRLMDPKLLLAGIVFFVAGWVIEKYILQ